MHVLDLRNTLLPLSLLELVRLFRRLDPMECIEIRFADSADRAVVLRVLPPACYDIILDDSLGDTGEGFRLRLRKKMSSDLFG